MKKFVFLALASVLLFFGLHVIYLIMFYSVPKTTAWTNNCLIKKENIALSLSCPKIIFTSGSNTLFGLRAIDVEKNIKIPSVNLAVHAGLETDYILYRAKKVLKPGDTIVLSFEYEDILWNGSYSEIRVAQILTHDQEYMKLLSIKERLSLYKNLTFFDISKSVKQKLEKVSEEPYHSSTLNDRGDETYNYDSKKIQANMKKVYKPFEIKPLGTRGQDEILKFKEWCDENNVNIFISWPATVYTKEYDTKEYRDFFSALISYFDKNNFKILGKPQDFIFPQSLFYDTSYHLNNEGMTIRTQKIISLLRKHGYGEPHTPSMSPK